MEPGRGAPGQWATAAAPAWLLRSSCSSPEPQLKRFHLAPDADGVHPSSQAVRELLAGGFKSGRLERQPHARVTQPSTSHPAAASNQGVPASCRSIACSCAQGAWQLHRGAGAPTGLLQSCTTALVRGCGGPRSCHRGALGCHKVKIGGSSWAGLQVERSHAHAHLPATPVGLHDCTSLLCSSRAQPRHSLPGPPHHQPPTTNHHKPWC